MGSINDDWVREVHYWRDRVKILQEENQELRELVRLLTIKEMSTSGKEFYPNKIQSCRALDGKRICEIIEKYK
jgi:hypothetical protein